MLQQHVGIYAEATNELASEKIKPGKTVVQPFHC
jgi:hypothetical protein